jgi:uncharacterized membrane protein
VRRRHRALLLAALAASGGACRQEKPAPPAEDAVAPPPAQVPAADSTTPDLAGAWTVVGHRIPGVSAMSEREAARWHGRTLRLDLAQAVSEESHCDRPSYATRRVVPESLLGREFQLPPGRLPSLAALDSLTLLEVRCAGSPWNAMGGRLIGIDSARAYAPWDGVFFELTRSREFKAIGQEPGWSLEISPGKAMTFRYAYGESTAVTPVPSPNTERATGARVYHARTEASDLRVVIEPRPCTDAMSGEPFETTVSVVLNGKAYSGCGAPAP